MSGHLTEPGLSAWAGGVRGLAAWARGVRGPGLSRSLAGAGLADRALTIGRLAADATAGQITGRWTAGAESAGAGLIRRASLAGYRYLTRKLSLARQRSLTLTWKLSRCSLTRKLSLTRQRSLTLTWKLTRRSLAKSTLARHGCLTGHLPLALARCSLAWRLTLPLVLSLSLSRSRCLARRARLGRRLRRRGRRRPRVAQAVPLRGRVDRAGPAVFLRPVCVPVLAAHAASNFLCCYRCAASS